MAQLCYNVNCLFFVDLLSRGLCYEKEPKYYLHLTRCGNVVGGGLRVTCVIPNAWLLKFFEFGIICTSSTKQLSGNNAFLIVLVPTG